MAARFYRTGHYRPDTASGGFRWGVYEWSPSGALGLRSFSLRFLSPDISPGCRTYHLEPLALHHMTGSPTTEIERIAERGYRLLRRDSESSTSGVAGEVPDPHEFLVSLALFANRDLGQHAVGRALYRIDDLFDPNDLKSAEPIAAVVGLGTGPNKGGRRARAAAVAKAAVEHGADRELLNATPAEAVRQLIKITAKMMAASAGPRSGAARPSLARLLDDALSPDSRAAQAMNLIPGRQVLGLFLGGRSAFRSAGQDQSRVADRIRSAFICDYSDGEDYSALDRDAIFRVERGLRRAVLRHSGAPDRLSSWLRIQCADGFVGLTGGTRLRGEERARRSRMARRWYRDRLWRAFGQVARCFGRLMEEVFYDFMSHNEHDPSYREGELFLQWHYPQDYLAGLPIDFLGRPQLWLILDTLTEFWSGRSTPSPVDFCRVTNILTLFGDWTQNVRAADRKRKRAADGWSATNREDTIGRTAYRAAQDAVAAVENDAPRLRSLHCPVCGDWLRVSKVVNALPPSLIHAEMYCPGCVEQRDYLIAPEDFGVLG